MARSAARVRLAHDLVRLNRWAKAGVLERVVRELQQELLIESDTRSLDSTIIPLTRTELARSETGARPS